MKKIVLQTEQELTISDFIDHINVALRDLPHNEIARVIAMIELSFEDADIAVDLINHFEAVKQQLMAEDPQDYTEKVFKPKLLTRSSN